MHASSEFSEPFENEQDISCLRYWRVSCEQSYNIPLYRDQMFGFGFYVLRFHAKNKGSVLPESNLLKSPIPDQVCAMRPRLLIECKIA